MQPFVLLYQCSDVVSQVSQQLQLSPQMAGCTCLSNMPGCEKGVSRLPNVMRSATAVGLLLHARLAMLPGCSHLSYEFYCRGRCVSLFTFLGGPDVKDAGILDKLDLQACMLHTSSGEGLQQTEKIHEHPSENL